MIEQGKVERILSSSAKERRAIFEEAAGISRFKAKKIEAQRRLDRVDTNLVRLADIVDEVGSRYRSVKNQASKAAKYKDYADRLQELRTYVGLKDWRSFSEKLTGLESKIAELDQEATRLNSDLDSDQKQARETEAELDALSEKIIQQQELSSQTRERIAQAESQIELNQSRRSDLTERLEQLDSQIEKFGQRESELQQRIGQCHHELESAQQTHDSATQRLTHLEDQVSTLGIESERLHAETQQNRSKHSDLIGLIAELGKQVSGFSSVSYTHLTLPTICSV